MTEKERVDRIVFRSSAPHILASSSSSRLMALISVPQPVASSPLPRRRQLGLRGWGLGAMGQDHGTKMCYLSATTCGADLLGPNVPNIFQGAYLPKRFSKGV